MDHILSGLNDAQRCAVASPSPVVQVLAPPGSGKTKTLTSRVAYLISHEGYKPWDIIVCTFTIKAAREMKERIRGFVGEALMNKLILGTFHSVARRYLYHYGHYIGIKRDFGIADTSDTMAILKRIKKRHDYTIEPSVARSRISKVKAKSTDIKAQSGIEKQEFDAIYEEYEETLKASNLLDYDDLLLRCADLLREHPDCVSNVQTILIDEFQDTNHVQYDLMCLFSQRRGRITIVGDPDQSIYAFRSAEVKNVRKMQKQYPQTHVVLLEENYRSSGSILVSALELIEQDQSRPAKKLLATHTTGEQPVLRRLPSPKAEGTWIVEEIQRSKGLTGGVLSFSDYAILIRSGSQSHATELALGKAGIPYRMVGGHKFFDRLEVKILLNYLRVIGLPDHNDAVINVMNVPSRGIGEKTFKDLTEEAERRKIPLWQLVQNAAQGRGKMETKLKTQAQKGVEAFVGIIMSARKKLLSTDSPATVAELVDFLISRLNFETFLRKSHGEDFESRWENIEELRLQAAQLSMEPDNDGMDYDEALPAVEGVDQHQSSGSEAMLTRFLANVALATDAKTAGDGVDTDQVTISTMHAAKGLEWPVVFIASVFDGSIPHSRAEDHDEERRLLYVAMTRAQALLYLSCPMKSSSAGSSNAVTLSSFLSQPTMSRYFKLSGARFSFSMVQDLARILRRSCPEETALFECQKTVERLEDDYWPLDGRDIEPEASQWDLSSQNSEFQFGVPSKRQKLDAAIGSATSWRTAASAVRTTMQSGANFSVSTTTMSAGFVSAGNLLKELNAQELNVRNLSAKPKAASFGSGKIAAVRDEKAALESKRRPSKKPPASQGNLLSFFGKKP